MLHDPKVPYRFQIGGEGGPTYLLKVPTVSDRVAYRHALRKAGAVRWLPLQMIQALADGVRQIIDDPAERESLLEQVDGYRDQITTFSVEVRDGQIDNSDPIAFMAILAERMRPPKIVEDATVIVSQHVPAYMAKVADNEVYSELAGLVAARMFLLGWEGVEAPFRRSASGIPDEILGAVPQGHLEAIGGQVEKLLEPPQARLGNSPSLSGEPSGPTASNGAGREPQSILSPTTSGHLPS